jgi:hypothetical protein
MIRVVSDRRVDGRTALLLGALVLAAAASLSFALVPVSHEESTSGGTSDGAVFSETRTSSETLVESEGPSVLVTLAVPVVPAVVALTVRRRTATKVAAWLTGLFCLVGAMSIGLFYVPAAVTLGLAARRGQW